MQNGKCFIYCRQSSGQEDADNSISIQQQLQGCLEQAARRGLEVVGVFTDTNVSGKTYPKGEHFEKIAQNDSSFNQWFKQQRSTKKFREGLGEMFKRLDEVEYVIVDEITRLHRSTAKSFLEQAITYEITTAKVKIIQVKGDVLDLSKFDQNLIHMLRTQINDEQIALQKKKSVESRLRLKDGGVLACARFFAGVYDGNKQFHFEPRQAEVVRYVFDSILGGKTYSQIYYEINQRFRDRLGPAKMFYESSLRHIATQPIYAGYMYNSHDELIKCQNAPATIISLKEFQQAQEIMEHKRQRNKHTRADQYRKRILPFTGYLKCGHCQGNMIVIVDKGKVFYKCKQGDLVKTRQCRESRVLVSYEKREGIGGLKDAVAPLLIIAFLQRHKKYQWYQQGVERIEQIRQEAQKLRGKIKTAFDLYCQDILDEEGYTETTRERMAEVKKLQKQVREIELNADIDFIVANRGLLDETAKFMEDFQRLSDSRYEELLRVSLEKVLVFKERVTIETAMGSFTLPRFAKDQRQKNVFTAGNLKTTGETGVSYFDPSARYIIEYDYRKQTTKDKGVKTAIGKMGNIELFRIDESQDQ